MVSLKYRARWASWLTRLNGGLTSSREALDRIFGYDFFISYAHADGRNYVSKIKTLLEERRFRVCVDVNEFSVGDSIDAVTRRRIRGSRRLIVICRPAAITSSYVRLEVLEFVSRRGHPLVIDVNGTLGSENASWLRSIIGDDLYVVERLAELDADPSVTTINVLEQGFAIRRTESVRTTAFAVMATIFMFLAVFAGIQWWWQTQETRNAQAGRYAVESAFERTSDPKRAIEKAICAFDKRPLTSSVDALVAAVRNMAAVERAFDNLGDEALDAEVLQDQRRIAVASSSGRVIVRDARTGAQLQKISAFQTSATALTSTEDDQLVVGSGRGELATVNLRTGVASQLSPAQHAAGVTRLLLLDKEHIASVAWDNNLVVWSLKTRTAVCAPPPAHRSGAARTGINDASFDSRRKLIFTVGADGGIGAWDVTDPAKCSLVSLSRDESGSSKMYWSVAVDETSGLISLGTYDGVVEFRTFDEKALRFDRVDVAEADGEPSYQRLVNGLAIDPKNQRLLVARSDGTLTEWDIQPSHEGTTANRRPAPVQVWRAHGQKINSVRVYGVGRRALTAAGDRVITWDFDAAASVASSFRPMNGSEVRTSISKSGQYVLSWNENNEVVVYSDRRSTPISYRKATFHGRIVAGAVSDDGERVALGTEFGEVNLHSLTTDESWSNTPEEQYAQIQTLAFHPQRHDIVFAGLLDRSVVKLKVSSDVLRTTLVDRFAAIVSALALSKDRGLLAAAPTSLGPIGLFDLDRLSRTSPEIAYRGAEQVRGLSFSRSGRWLALASSGGVVRMNDLEAGQTREFYFRKSDDMRAVSFSDDDKLLGSVGDSNTVALWNLEQSSYAWQIPNAAVRRLDRIEFGPQAKIVTADDFGNVARWAAEPRRWREAGSRILGQADVLACD